MPAPDTDITAGELALGLLEGAERAAALRRLLSEPEFAREVERWRAHLGAWFAAWPEVEAPPGLFGRIEASIDSRPRALPVRVWQAATAASSLIAACLLIALFVRPAGPPPLAPARPLVASIAPTAQGSGAPIAAVYDTATGAIKMASAAAVPEGKSAELWAIGSDGAPRAIGLLAADGPSRLPLPIALRGRIAAGLTLAISIEPRGGSPTGKPTGPVVAAGTLIQA